MTLPFSWVTSMCRYFYFVPVMPAIFYVHDHSTHAQMMEVIVSQLPSLVQGSSRIPMVTDDEKGFVQAVDKVLHNVRRFYSWNHVINATKLWPRRHGATSSEEPVYLLSQGTVSSRIKTRLQ